MAEDTKKYVVKVDGVEVDGQTYNEGDEVELTEAQATELGENVAPVDAENDITGDEPDDEEEEDSEDEEEDEEEEEADEPAN